MESRLVFEGGGAAMESISLNGLWKASAEFSTELEFTAPGFDDSGWTDIAVPSHWQECEKFAEYPEKLVYRTSFEFAGAPEGVRAFLRFKGVFYFARVWLNGRYLGEHTGAFTPFSFEVTDALAVGANTLAVFARCEIERDLDDKRQITGVFSHWDCKPKDVQPGGIWNDVEIVFEPAVYVRKLSIGNFVIRDEEAIAIVEAAVGGLGARADGAALEWVIRPVTFEGDELSGRVSLEMLNAALNEVSFEVVIPEPRLWWTWDHGAADLYELEVSLRDMSADADNGLETVESRKWKTRFGVRAVEFENGEFRLNGRRIFIRGTNYGPADIRIARATEETYRHDVRLLRGANCNMVRAHAHIEKDGFYDLCDEAGILVWQDFPLHWYYSLEIVDEARSQARAMIDHLGGHPSVAVWCCHNEPMLHYENMPFKDVVREGRIGDFFNSVKSFFGPNPNKEILDKRVHEAVREADPSRPAVIYSGDPGLFGEGTDSHHYFGWYVGTMRMIESVARLFRNSFRFVTEYGAQAFPSMESFRKMQNVTEFEAVDWVELQRRNMLQKNLMDKYVPPAGPLDDYIERTQWYQARLVKYHNEFFRRMKYRPCGGAVHFMLADCAPGVTWAVVDYWRKPKAAYAELGESFRPLHVFADFPRRRYRRGTALSLRVYAVNDLYQRFDGAKVRWFITDAARGTVARGEWNIDIAEDSIGRVGRLHWDTSRAAAGGYGILLELDTGGQSISNQYEFELK